MADVMCRVTAGDGIEGEVIADRVSRVTRYRRGDVSSGISSLLFGYQGEESGTGHADCLASAV